MKKLETDVHLLKGDVVTILKDKARDGEEYDVIVTSPPYNIGKNYGEGVSDKRKPAEYLSWVDDWMGLVKEVLAEKGSLFLNIGSTPKDPLLALRVAGVAEGHFKVQNMIHWVKSATLPFGASEKSVGHFKPINSNRFLNVTHEYLIHLTHEGDVGLDRKAKGVGVAYADESNIKRWKHSGGTNLRCRGNVWVIPYETIQNSNKQRPHPASFPVSLAERAIRLHGGDLREHRVLDPFVGIGTSGVAAVRCGVKEFTGIDIDAGDYYLAEAGRRIGQQKEDLFGSS